MDCCPPGCSVYGIFQARILEWVAVSFSRGSSWPRYRTQISCIAGRFFTIRVVGPLLHWNLVAQSQWWESERWKEANIPWVSQLAFLLQGISQKESEREREKERKKDTGTQALMEQRCFNQHSVGIYIVLQGSYSQQRWRVKFQTYKKHKAIHIKEREL